MSTYDKVEEIQRRANNEIRVMLRAEAIKITEKEFGEGSVRSMLDDDKLKVSVRNEEIVLTILDDFQVMVDDRNIPFDYFEEKIHKVFN